MVRAALIAFALLLAGPVAAQETTPEVDLRGAPMVWRTTLLVSDLDRARAFWEDVIGLELAYDRASGVTDPRLARLFGLEEGEAVLFLILRAGNLNAGMIGVMQVDGGVAPQPMGPRPFAGTAAIMLQTEDLAGVLARAEAAGITILARPDGAIENGSMAFLRGPDGVRVVLTSRDAIKPVYEPQD